MKNNLQLPDIEKVVAVQHNKWVADKQGKGFTEVVNNGENILVPFDQLSDAAKLACRERTNMFYEALNEVYTEENATSTQQEATQTTH